MSAILGELFCSGYFFDPNDNTSINSDLSGFVDSATYISIICALFMVPFKIITSFLATCKDLNENSTRKEIEEAERKAAKSRMIAYILIGCWLAGCIYSISMFVMSFSAVAMSKWLITWGTSFGMDAIVMFCTKISITVIVGLILVKLAAFRGMLSATGGTIGKMLEVIIPLAFD